MKAKKPKPRTPAETYDAARGKLQRYADGYRSIARVLECRDRLREAEYKWATQRVARGITREVFLSAFGPQ